MSKNTPVYLWYHILNDFSEREEATKKEKKTETKRNLKKYCAMSEDSIRTKNSATEIFIIFF